MSGHSLYLTGRNQLGGCNSPPWGIMAIYEYFCQGCGANFDKLVSQRNKDSISCPDCGCKVDRNEVYAFSYCLKNIVTSGTQGGEGFTSTTYNPKEADIRAKHNLSKGDKV